MKITKGAVIRVILLVIVLINLVLKAAGKPILEIDEGSIAGCIEMLIEVLVIVVTWWYNNSFSENAKKADEFLKQLNESEEV